MFDNNQKMLQPARSAAMGDEQQLAAEISIIRKLIGMVEKEAEDFDDVKQLLHMLNVVSSASDRLARLLRAQRDIAEHAASSNTLRERMDRILVDLAREKGIID